MKATEAQEAAEAMKATEAPKATEAARLQSHRDVRCPIPQTA